MKRTLHRFRNRLGFFQRVSHWLPHPAKAATGGEDSFIATDCTLGVADGVSWWAETLKGTVSAGTYSELLTRNAYDVVFEDWLTQPPETLEHPSLSLLTTSFERTKPAVESGEAYLKEFMKQTRDDEDAVAPPKPSSSPLIIGTTTALFATITAQDTLDIANIGDCTGLLLRNGAVVLETTAQHHDLSTPYQIGTGSKSTPADAHTYQCPVAPGDIVVIGSDGIFDNVFVADVLQIISERMRDIATNKLLDISALNLSSPPHPTMTTHDYQEAVATITTMSPERFAFMSREDRELVAIHVAALQILRQACLNAFDPRCATPYAAACIEEGAYFEGGKIDDMTLVIGIVGYDSVSLGDRVLTSSLSNCVPYKNWP